MDPKGNQSTKVSGSGILININQLCISAPALVFRMPPPLPVGFANSLGISQSAICAGCGCLCDDIVLRPQEDNLEVNTRGCVKGQEWFSQTTATGPPALVDGKQVSLAEAIQHAALVLCQANNSLIFGLERITCEAAARVVAMADWLGANLDTTASFNQGPTGLAFQGVGEIACSLGEVRNRADFVVFWGADPDRTHPRHTERYSIHPPGIHVPLGRRGRFVVVVDPEDNQTARQADLWLKPKPGRDFEILWTLRALVQGLDVGNFDEEANGVGIDQLCELAAKMKSCRFGVLFFGQGLMTGTGHHLNADAAVGLAHDINAHTRFYARPLRGAGNPTGSDSVACWQTGYPFGINLARGFPKYNPGEFTTAALLERNEPDAALLVGVKPSDYLSQNHLKSLAGIPWIMVGNVDLKESVSAKVVIRTAPLATATTGTVYRMDDISLPLKAVISSPLASDEEVLAQLEFAILARLRAGLPAKSGELV